MLSASSALLSWFYYMLITSSIVRMPRAFGCVNLLVLPRSLILWSNFLSQWSAVCIVLTISVPHVYYTFPGRGIAATSEFTHFSSHTNPNDHRLLHLLTLCVFTNMLI